MPTSTFHVRKVSVGLKRKYRISADDGTGRPGELLGYAEKQLKVADEFALFRDEQRTQLLATVRESSRGWLAAITGYEVFAADERLLGSFGVLARKSIERSTWQFEQPGIERLVGAERSIATARVRRLLTVGGALGVIAGALVRYHFDFKRDGATVFSIDKPKVFDDWYRLTVHDDAIDTTLLFALAVAMEARQHK